VRKKGKRARSEEIDKCGRTTFVEVLERSKGRAKITSFTVVRADRKSKLPGKKGRYGCRERTGTRTHWPNTQRDGPSQEKKMQRARPPVPEQAIHEPYSRVEKIKE